MKKRFFIAMALTLLFIISSQTLVFAADFNIGTNLTAASGGTLTVPINVSNNQGFAAVGLVLSYNHNVLTITNVTGAQSGMPLNPEFTLTSTPGTQWISLVNIGGANWTGNGTVANVTFSVNPNADLGASNLSLAFTNNPAGDPANEAGTILASNLSNNQTATGSVNIVSPTPTPTATPTPTPTPASTPGGPTPTPSPWSPTPTPYPWWWWTTTPTPTPWPTPTPTPAGAWTSSLYDPPPPTVEPNIPPIDTYIDYGEFIGSGVDTETDDYYTTTYTPTYEPSYWVYADFGRVPQTNVPNIFMIVTGAVLSLTVSIALWLYLYRRKRRQQEDG